MDGHLTHLRCVYCDSNGNEVSSIMPVYITAAARTPPRPPRPSRPDSACCSHSCSRTGMHCAVFASMPHVYDHYGRRLEDEIEESTILPPRGAVRCVMGGQDQMITAAVATAPLQPNPALLHPVALHPPGMGFFYDPNISHFEERPTSPSPPEQRPASRDSAISLYRVMAMIQESALVARLLADEGEEEATNSNANANTTANADTRASTPECDAPPQDLLALMGRNADADLDETETVTDSSPTLDLKPPIQRYLNGKTSPRTMQLALRPNPKPKLLVEEYPMPSPYQETDFHKPTYCDRLAASPMPMTRPATRIGTEDAALNVSNKRDDTLDADADAVVGKETTASSCDWSLIHAPTSTFTSKSSTTSTTTTPPSLPRAASSTPCSCEALSESETHLPDCAAWEVEIVPTNRTRGSIQGCMSLTEQD